MDFEKKYFELYSRLADIIEELQILQSEFEADYCSNEENA